jgi:hypothetical protein
MEREEHISTTADDALQVRLPGGAQESGFLLLTIYFLLSNTK